MVIVNILEWFYSRTSYKRPLYIGGVDEDLDCSFDDCYWI